jgi:hypothetical protein
MLRRSLAAAALILTMLLLMTTACTLQAQLNSGEAAAGTDVASPTQLFENQLPATLMETPALTPLPQEVLRNMTYTFMAGQVAIDGFAATLTNGVFTDYNAELMADREIRLQEPVWLGDVNGDGAEDALVILVAHTEGTTGNMFYMFVMLNQNGLPVQAEEPAYLGDRIIVNSITIDASGLITADLMIVGANDGMCCPNTRSVQVYRLVGTRLVVEQGQ